MNESPNPARPFRWIGPIVVVLLVFQVGLAWLHGSLLNRQHQDLQDLREEVANLTDAVQQGDDAQEDDGAVAPARHARRPRERILRVRVQEAPEGRDGQEGGAREERQPSRELQAAQASMKKAAEQGRAVRSQLSLEDNARKAQEKAAARKETPLGWWIGGGVGGILALWLLRWLGKRN